MLAALRAAVAADLQGDLDRLEISDSATLKRFHRSLTRLALSSDRWADAHAHLDALTELEAKPASKAVAGLVDRAILTAKETGGGQIAFKAALHAQLEKVNYREVHLELKKLRAELETSTPAFVEGRLRASLRGAASSGNLSLRLIQELINARHHLDQVERFRPVALEELRHTIEMNNGDRREIWTARDVSLEGRNGLHPVTIAIWDSGVDPACFVSRIQHSVAYDSEGKRTSGALLPWRYGPEKEAELRRFARGWMDLMASVESDEVKDLRIRFDTMSAEETKDFLEEVAHFLNYVHGTHVAGIAIRNNPAARLVSARITFNETIPHREPTLEWGRRMAQMFCETSKFFRQHGARVANMSWASVVSGYKSKSSNWLEIVAFVEVDADLESACESSVFSKRVRLRICRIV